MPHLLYYITGHGFGHAQRSAEVVRELLRRREDVQVHIRTAAPEFIFADLGDRAHYQRVVIDRGCIEIDALTLDWDATLKQVQMLLNESPSIIARELDYIRRHPIRLIAADIPFLAGEIAAAAGIPCWAVGNFTWDWIYEPYADANRDLVARVRHGYEQMEGLLSIPFRHAMPHFCKVVDVPLIAARPRRNRAQVDEMIGLAADDSRPRVLAAMRGGIAATTLQQAAESSPELMFLNWGDIETNAAENLRGIATDCGLSFHDVLQAADVVVTKVGHGIVTDAIAMNIALLYPPRTGFREDSMLLSLAEPFLRARPIDLDDFHNGNWRQSLCLLLQQPKPAQKLAADGAAVVAGHLLDALGHSTASPR